MTQYKEINVGWSEAGIVKYTEYEEYLMCKSDGDICQVYLCDTPQDSLEIQRFMETYDLSIDTSDYEVATQLCTNRFVIQRSKRGYIACKVDAWDCGDSYFPITSNQAKGESPIAIDPNTHF